MEIATGEYIGFVDNDDYIDKHMYEVLYKTAEKYQADIVVCNYKEVYDNDQIINEQDISLQEQQLDNKGAILQMYKTAEDYIKYIVPWNKLYKKKLFNENKYQVGNIYDDETVAHKLLYNSQIIIYINSKLYYYLQRSGSQMNSTFHVKRFDKIYALKERVDYFKLHKEPELYQKALTHYMDMFFWYYYLAKSNLTNIDKELIAVKRTFNSSLPYLLKHKNISWKQKIMCILFSINPRLFDFFKGLKTTEKHI